MATTTNYSWTTPDDTALVKDGAAAIRSLGTAIDTTVFNNASAAIAKTIVDAKGDLIVATAADTVARLASSASNGDLLTVDTSTASGLKWAAPAASGGMTLLDTMTLSGSSTTSATFSSAYKQLIIYVKGAYIASGNEYHGIRLNGDSGSNYSWSADAIYNTTSVIQSTFNGTTFRLNSLSTTNADDDAQRGIIRITRPSDTDYVFINSDSWMRLTGSSQNQYWSVSGAYNNAAAITSITFLTEGSTYSGGTVYIYGVN